jgi:hypothetical protein
MNDYVRISDKGIEFKITTFVRDEKTICIMPVMHVAPKEFYDSIYARALKSEIVVLEGKRQDSANIFEAKQFDYNYIKHMSVLYYKVTKLYLEIIPGLLGLSKQSELYFKIKDNLNYVYGDINVDTQNFSPPYYESLNGIVEKLDELIDMASFRDKNVLYEKYYLKFAESAIGFRGVGNSDFNIRNEIAIKTVKDSLKNYNSVSMIYSLSHMPFFNEVITKSEFMPENEEWFIVMHKINQNPRK